MYPRGLMKTRTVPPRPLAHSRRMGLSSEGQDISRPGPGSLSTPPQVAGAGRRQATMSLRSARHPCGLRARSLGCGVSQHVCVQCLCLRGQEGPRGAVGAAGSGGRSPYEPADTPALGPSHSRGQGTMRQAPNPLRGQRKRVTLLQPDVKSPLTSTSSLGPKSRMTWEGICFY